MNPQIRQTPNSWRCAAISGTTSSSQIGTYSRILGFVSAALLASGCPTTPTAPTPPPVGLSLKCPTIPATATAGCPGLVLAGMTLTCSAAPAVGFVTGTNRVRVVLANGSTVKGNATFNALSFSGGCVPVGPAVPFTLTFGVDYTGAPSSTAPVCIAASKAIFTQFILTGASQDGVISPSVLDGVQKALDKEVRDLFNSTPLSPGTSPRCSTWRPLP